MSPFVMNFVGDVNHVPASCQLVRRMGLRTEKPFVMVRPSGALSGAVWRRGACPRPRPNLRPYAVQMSSCTPTLMRAAAAPPPPCTTRPTWARPCATTCALTTMW